MNHIKEEDWAISPQHYKMLIGKTEEAYTPGNYPKETLNQTAAKLHKLTVALNQYKQDAEDQQFINNLMTADLANVKDMFTQYAQISKCPTVQLLCSLIIINIEKIIANKNFDLNQLTA